MQLLDDPDLPRALRQRIAELRQKTNENDTVMIYAAGHGLRDQRGQFYLAGTATDLAHIERRRWPGTTWLVHSPP